MTLKVTNELLCTISRAEELGSCPGDSGGPLTIYDKKIKRFVLLGAVRGSLDFCNDLEFPSLFARLEDYQILKFVRKKAFDQDILPPEGTKGETIPLLKHHSHTFSCWLKAG